MDLFRRSMRWIAIPVLLLCTSPVNAQQSSAPAVGVQRYPDSSKGLKQLLEYAQQITQASKGEELKALARDLKIPDHPRWFASTFGGGLEDVLSAAYTESAREMESALPQLLSSLPTEKKWKLDLSRAASANADADSPLFLSLVALKRPTVFYQVRIERQKNTPLYLGYFVYVDGAFRLLGRMVIVSVAGPRSLLLLRPSDRFEPLRFIKPIHPKPPEKGNSSSTASNYWIVVDREGKAHLAGAAGADAKSVKAFAELLPRWQCTPAMLNGQPIEVVSLYTIQVTHSISMVEVP